GVQDFLRRPLSSADLGQLLDRLGRRSMAAPAPLGKVVFFIGNKGGVGKSTVALNVACGLAVRHPDRVLLIDASLQMGVCATMLDRVMMAVLDLSDRAYIILESVVPTLLGGAKLLKLLTSLGFPPDRQRVVLNRYMNFAGNLKPADVAHLLERQVDHVVPYQKA